MTSTVSVHLDDVEQAFLLSPVVRSFQVRERAERLHEGFIRLTAVLSNGDLLEAFEFVVATADALQTLTYRIHWQQGDGRLKLTGATSGSDLRRERTMAQSTSTQIRDAIVAANA